MNADKSPNVEILADRYMAEHAEVFCKPLTVVGYRDRLRQYILPALGDKLVKNVTRADLASFHHSLSKVPYQANRCLEMLSKMFNLAEMWGWRPDNSNPRKHIRKFKERKRERFLNGDETKRLMAVLTRSKLDGHDLAASYCLRLLFLTGCRLSEILKLRWEHVNETKSCLSLPDSKVGARDVYVSRSVMDLLMEIRICDCRPITNPYVIWGRKPDTYLKDVQKRWQRFQRKADLKGVRIHDLRHSFASYAVNQGISLYMVARLLGHSQVQTTARYAHLESDSVKTAANVVTGRILEVSN